MFCPKCGKEVENSRFCPFCGSKIELDEERQVSTIESPQVDTSKEILEETPETTSQETASQETTSEEKPKEQLAEPMEQMPAETNSFGIQPPKKKKWLKIVGIVAAAFIILGAGIYFAYPVINQMINPRAYAVSAIKNTTQKIQGSLCNAFDNKELTSNVDNQEVSISFKLDKLDLKDNSALSDLSGNNVTMTIQRSTKDNVMAGTISLGANDASALSIEYYIDQSNLYFKIPQLSNKQFLISMSSLTSNSDSTYSTLFNRLDTSSSAEIQKYINQYSTQIKAVIQDVIKGVDTMMDNADYTKTDGKTYQSENGDKKVSIYDIVIDEDAVKKGIVATINSLFEDKELSSYVSMLTMFTKQTKQDLISRVESANLDINQIPFTIYINHKKEIVKAIFDFNKITGDAATASVEFIGKDNIYDYIVVNMESQQAKVKFVSKKDKDEFGLKLEANLPDESIYKDQFLNIEIQGKSQISGSDADITINRMNASCNYQGETFETALSGKVTTKSIDAVTTSKSDYAKAIDIETMTNQDKKSVLTEMSNNLGNLKGKLSDSILKQLNSFVNSALATLK